MPVASNNCPLCRGAQWIYEYQEDEEIVARRCLCLERQTLLSYLGPEIFYAKHLQSDLYKPRKNDETNELEGDRTEDNLFLKGSWETVCRHLRWVLASKHRFVPSFNFKILPDQRLLGVWLSKEAYNQRAADVRNDIETFNTLEDLIEGPQLLILRLGFLSTPNRAMPGVLKQALMIREVALKATWIIEGTELFYGDGHRSYDPDVGKYIDDHFDIVTIEDEDGSSAEVDILRIDDGEDTIGMGPGVATPKVIQEGSAVVSRFVPTIDPDPTPRPKFKKYKPGWGRKGGSGGSGLPEVG